jgi:hypothetical protein
MKPKWLLFGFLCLLQIGDVLSTRLASVHGAVELNPIVRASGLWQAKLLALFLIFLLVRRSEKLRSLYFLTATYAAVVGWNCLTARLSG